jgi:hypothetical protein
MATVATVPFGNSKGKPLGEAEEKDLKFVFEAIAQKLTDNPNKDYAAKDRQLLGLIKAELVAKRGHDGAQYVIPTAPPAGASAPARTAPAQAAPQQTSALAKIEGATLVGSTRNTEQINDLLEKASRDAHLITPATVCGSLPEGCEVALSFVKVNPDASKSGPGDVSEVGGGKLNLAAHVIKKIGAAAGVSWVTNESGRLDNGSDPHYVHFRAVGTVKNFDGSLRKISGEVEIDMREGSPQVVAMEQRAKDGSNFASQLRDTRFFILRHAETKAKARAIIDLGMKRSYTAAELAKPFQVARLMWTGRTDDPELRRIFAEKQADAMIGANAMLYGGQPMAPVRQAPPQVQAGVPYRQIVDAPQPAQLGHAPPPVGGISSDDEDEAAGEQGPAESTPRPAARPAKKAEPTGEIPDEIEQPYAEKGGL